VRGPAGLPAVGGRRSGWRAQGDRIGDRNRSPSEPVVETRPAAEAGVDFTPKELSPGQAFLTAVKFLAVAGAITLLFWLMEKFL
jgi:hypothetical protein